MIDVQYLLRKYDDLKFRTHLRSSERRIAARYCLKLSGQPGPLFLAVSYRLSAKAECWVSSGRSG